MFAYDSINHMFVCVLPKGLDYEFGDNFGEPDKDGDFQDPRIVRFSVGIRF